MSCLASRQTQVSPKIELTFAEALRAILRQDPRRDRDRRNPRLRKPPRSRSRLHDRPLVLATLHTNDAPQRRRN